MLSLLRDVLASPLLFLMATVIAGGYLWLTIRLIRGLSTALAGFLVVSYSLVILFITLRPLPTPGLIRSIQWVPVIPLLTDSNNYPLLPSLANIALFVPFGFLLNYLVNDMRKAVLISTGLSAAIELAQLVEAAGRQTDINDVILNLIGALIGVSGAMITRRFSRAAALPQQ